MVFCKPYKNIISNIWTYNFLTCKPYKCYGCFGRKKKEWKNVPTLP